MTRRVPSRGSDQFNLRLPDGLRDEIKARADAAGRSMNAEIVARLLDSLAADDGVRVPEAALDLILQLKHEIENINGRIADVERGISRRATK